MCGQCQYKSGQDAYIRGERLCPHPLGSGAALMWTMGFNQERSDADEVRFAIQHGRRIAR